MLCILLPIMVTCNSRLIDSFLTSIVVIRGSVRLRTMLTQPAYTWQAWRTSLDILLKSFSDIRPRANCGWVLKSGEVRRRQPPCLCFRPLVMYLSPLCSLWRRISASSISFVRYVSVTARMWWLSGSMMLSAIVLHLLRWLVTIPCAFRRENFLCGILLCRSSSAGI